ncbi:MAG: aldo/keto reductase [Candidatus Krumholzibacteriia bacterium]
MTERVTTRTGLALPRLGLGTWRMGEDRSRRRKELAALQRGLDLGLLLVDTAEMYGDGAAEELVGEALRGRRDQAVLVSKVLPVNASREGTRRACEASLRRLQTDHLDLYLLHWPGPHLLEDTLAAFADLVRDGKIRHYGVSNFDRAMMERAERLPGGESVAVNQVYYGLGERGPEWDLLPWCREHGVPVMAYSPFDGGDLLRHPVVCAVAERRRATPAQVALAWLLEQEGVVTFPKAGSVQHVEDDAAARDLRLGDDDRRELETALPPPSGPSPLATR